MKKVIRKTHIVRVSHIFVYMMESSPTGYHYGDVNFVFVDECRSLSEELLLLKRSYYRTKSVDICQWQLIYEAVEVYRIGTRRQSCTIEKRDPHQCIGHVRFLQASQLHFLLMSRLRLGRSWC